MARHDYNLAKPIVAAFFTDSCLTSIAGMTPEQLNTLYDQLEWERDANEKTHKTNLIAWIRRHFPDYDEAVFAKAKLIRESMALRPVSEAEPCTTPQAPAPAPRQQPSRAAKVPKPEVIDLSDEVPPTVQSKSKKTAKKTTKKRPEPQQQQQQQTVQPCPLPLHTNLSHLAAAFEENLGVSHSAFNTGDWMQVLIALGRCTAIVFQVESIVTFDVAQSVPDGTEACPSSSDVVGTQGVCGVGVQGQDHVLQSFNLDLEDELSEHGAGELVDRGAATLTEVQAEQQAADGVIN